MSWGLLQDRDNWLRNGKSSIVSAPPARVGYSRDALHDGTQAIPYVTAGQTTDTISLSVPGEELRYLALHDLRWEAPEPPGVVLLVDGAVEKVWDPAEVLRGSMHWCGKVTPTTQVQIQVHPLGQAWSLGEIVLGGELVVAGDGCSPDPARDITVSQAWSTVENGPWRSKLAEPRKTYALSFAPTDFERTMLLLEHSEGGLRPVSFAPRLGGYETIHGHLAEEYSATMGLGGIWQEGMDLVVHESARRLR